MSTSCQCYKLKNNGLDILLDQQKQVIKSPREDKSVSRWKASMFYLKSLGIFTPLSFFTVHFDAHFAFLQSFTLLFHSSLFWKKGWTKILSSLSYILNGEKGQGGKVQLTPSWHQSNLRKQIGGEFWLMFQSQDPHQKHKDNTVRLLQHKMDFKSKKLCRKPSCTTQSTDICA